MPYSYNFVPNCISPGTTRPLSKSTRTQFTRLINATTNGRDLGSYQTSYYSGSKCHTGTQALAIYPALNRFQPIMDLAMTHLPTEFRDWLSYLEDVLVYSTDLWGQCKRQVVQGSTRQYKLILEKGSRISHRKSRFFSQKWIIQDIK